MDTHDQHQSFIKTPQQLIVVLLLSFIVPVVSIILLVQLVLNVSRPDPNTLTPEAIGERIKPVARVEFGAPGGAAGARSADQIVKTTPDGIHLTSIKQTNRRLQIKGLAQSSTRVASYMRNLDASEWLADPSLDILQTKGSGDAGSEFTLQASQENPLLPKDSEAQVASTGGAR